MILALEFFFWGEMHGFFRSRFFSEARCKDSCLGIFFLTLDSLILTWQKFFWGEIHGFLCLGVF